MAGPRTTKVSETPLNLKNAQLLKCCQPAACLKHLSALNARELFCRDLMPQPCSSSLKRMHEPCARSNAGKHPASQFPNDSGNEARPIVGLRKRARGVKVRSVTRPKHAAVFPRTATAGSRCTNCAAQCAQGSGGNERGNSAFAVKAACKCCTGRARTIAAARKHLSVHWSVVQKVCSR